MTSSRLAVDQRGRLYVVITTPSPETKVGRAFRVLGNELPVAEVGVRWLGARTGRPPADAERVRVLPGARLPGEE